MDKSSNLTTEDKPKPMIKPEFSWQINLGHILQVGAIMFGITIGWFALEKRISMVESKGIIYEREQEKVQQALNIQREALTTLIRQMDRLAIITEKKIAN